MIRIAQFQHLRPVLELVLFSNHIAQTMHSHRDTLCKEFLASFMDPAHCLRHLLPDLRDVPVIQAEEFQQTATSQN